MSPPLLSLLSLSESDPDELSSLPCFEDPFVDEEELDDPCFDEEEFEDDDSLDAELEDDDLEPDD